MAVQMLVNSLQLGEVGPQKGVHLRAPDSGERRGLFFFPTRGGYGREQQNHASQ